MLRKKMDVVALFAVVLAALVQTGHGHGLRARTNALLPQNWEELDYMGLKHAMEKEDALASSKFLDMGRMKFEVRQAIKVGTVVVDGGGDQTQDQASEPAPASPEEGDEVAGDSTAEPAQTAAAAPAVQGLTIPGSSVPLSREQEASASVRSNETGPGSRAQISRAQAKDRGIPMHFKVWTFNFEGRGGKLTDSGGGDFSSSQRVEFENYFNELDERPHVLLAQEDISTPLKGFKRVSSCIAEEWWWGTGGQYYGEGPNGHMRNSVYVRSDLARQLRYVADNDQGHGSFNLEAPAGYVPRCAAWARLQFESPTGSFSQPMLFVSVHLSGGYSDDTFYREALTTNDPQGHVKRDELTTVARFLQEKDKTMEIATLQVVGGDMNSFPGGMLGGQDKYADSLIKQGKMPVGSKPSWLAYNTVPDKVVNKVDEDGFTLSRLPNACEDSEASATACRSTRYGGVVDHFFTQKPKRFSIRPKVMIGINEGLSDHNYVQLEFNLLPGPEFSTMPSPATGRLFSVPVTTVKKGEVFFHGIQGPQNSAGWHLRDYLVDETNMNYRFFVCPVPSASVVVWSRRNGDGRVVVIETREESKVIDMTAANYYNNLYEGKKNCRCENGTCKSCKLTKTGTVNKKCLSDRDCGLPNAMPLTALAKKLWTKVVRNLCPEIFEEEGGAINQDSLTSCFCKKTPDPGLAKHFGTVGIKNTVNENEYMFCYPRETMKELNVEAFKPDLTQPSLTGADGQPDTGKLGKYYRDLVAQWIQSGKKPAIENFSFKKV